MLIGLSSFSTVGFLLILALNKNLWYMQGSKWDQHLFIKRDRNRLYLKSY